MVSEAKRLQLQRSKVSRKESMTPRLTRILVWLAVMFAAAQAFADDSHFVEREEFTLPSYTTTYGVPIADVKIGFERYGHLNTSKDNVILVTHYFNGTAHAAGRYRGGGPPAYWDKIIGPGKALDTDKYFVLSADSLVNLNVHDGVTITTGPATRVPGTTRHYGLSFPVVTILDFVQVQKALLDKLGIRKIRAVIGASMGALQAFAWGAAYPDMVERIIPVVGAPELDSFGIHMMSLWSMPVRADPDWNDGNYYGGRFPIRGLEQSVKIMTQLARASGWQWESNGRLASNNSDPTLLVNNRFLVEESVNTYAAKRANDIDANSLLYLARAVQLFVVGRGTATDPGHQMNADQGLKLIKADALLIGASSDLLFPPGQVRKSCEQMQANGNYVEYFEIEGKGGHFDGVANVDQADARIRKLLEKKPGKPGLWSRLFGDSGGCKWSHKDGSQR